MNETLYEMKYRNFFVISLLFKDKGDSDSKAGFLVLFQLLDCNDLLLAYTIIFYYF